MRDAKSKKKIDSNLMAGFAMAITSIVRYHDQPTMAGDIIKGYGFTLKDFAGVEEFDLKVIRKLFKDGEC